MSSRLRVGIVGANGFIGGRLAEWLILHDRAQVRPIVRSYNGMVRLGRFALDVCVASATDQVALVEALAGCDVLFHCVVGDRATILKSAETAYRACALAGVRRLVYLSSAVVLGHNPAPGTNDDSELVTQQPFEYNVSKVMAEHLLRRLRADDAVEVVTLRPAIVFGPRSRWWTAQIASDLLEDKALLVDNGSGVCNTVYVDNLVHAMWQAATVDRAANQDFLITDGQRVTWRELYQAVAEAVGVSLDTVQVVEGAAVSHQQLVQQRRKRLAFLQPLRTIFARTGGRLIPGHLKAILRQGIKTLYLGPQADVPQLSLDQELVSLQRCQYVLPIDKARAVLEYDPSYTFTEGCARTASWLRFAFGYDTLDLDRSTFLRNATMDASDQMAVIP